MLFSLGYLILPETCSDTGGYLWIPREVKGQVAEYLTSEERYSLLIQHRCFKRFLEKIRKYSLVESREDAARFFLRLNHNQLATCLTAPTLELALGGLKQVASGFLSLRAKLFSEIVDCELSVTDKDFDEALRGIGLLASTERLKILSMRALPAHESFMSMLSNNLVVDISPLTALVNLRSLDLSRTPVKDISAVSGMLRLTVLGLSGYQLTNLRPLENLTELRGLYLFNTSIEDLRPLSRLTALRILYLGERRDMDLSPLKNLLHVQVHPSITQRSSNRLLNKLRRFAIQKPLCAVVFLSSTCLLIGVIPLLRLQGSVCLLPRDIMDSGPFSDWMVLG